MGGVGSDVILGNDGPNVLVGINSAFGGVSADRIDGRGGKDTIYGSAGSGVDTLIGGPGPDRIVGAPLSNEVIRAQDGERDEISCPDDKDADEAYVDLVDYLIPGRPNLCENIFRPTLTLSGVAVRPQRFCKTKSEKCPRPGATLSFKLSSAAQTVKATIVKLAAKKSDTTVKTLTYRNRKKGTNAIRFSGSGLSLGNYRLKLRATAAPDGPSSKTTTTSFQIACSR